MDIDDNDAQDQNHQLVGEGNSKVTPLLCPYAHHKFEFDDSLQEHLRFDSLVENEVFLGITSQEDDNWIEEYSRETSEIQFSSCVVESSRKNVWSEATSFESVEMLLKSVGQEEKVVEETVIKELDVCEPGSLTNIMDPNPNLHENIESKVSSDCEASIAEFESQSQVSGGEFNLVFLGEENVDKVCDDVHHEANEIANASSVNDLPEQNFVAEADCGNAGSSRDDDVSEATSFKSVEMNLKSVGQEEKVVQEVVNEDLDVCEPGSLTNTIDPNPNLHENIESKVSLDCEAEFGYAGFSRDVDASVEESQKNQQDVSEERIEDVDIMGKNLNSSEPYVIIKNEENSMGNLTHSSTVVETCTYNEEKGVVVLNVEYVDTQPVKGGIPVDEEPSVSLPVESCDMQIDEQSETNDTSVPASLICSNVNEEPNDNMHEKSVDVSPSNGCIETQAVEDTDMKSEVSDSLVSNVGVVSSPFHAVEETENGVGCVLKLETGEGIEISDVGETLSTSGSSGEKLSEVIPDKAESVRYNSSKAYTENANGESHIMQVGDEIRSLEPDAIARDQCATHDARLPLDFIDIGIDVVGATDSQKNTEPSSPFDVNEGVITIGQESESNMADITDAVTATETSKASSPDILDGVQLPYGPDDIVDVNEDHTRYPILGVSLCSKVNEEPNDNMHEESHDVSPSSGCIETQAVEEIDNVGVLSSPFHVNCHSIEETENGVGCVLKSEMEEVIAINIFGETLSTSGSSGEKPSEFIPAKDEPAGYNSSKAYTENSNDESHIMQVDDEIRSSPDVIATDQCATLNERHDAKLPSDSIDMDIDVVGATDSQKNVEPSSPADVNEGVIGIVQGSESNMAVITDAVTDVESSKASSLDIPDGVSLLYNDNEVKVEVGSSKKGPHEVDGTLDCSSDDRLPVVDHCDSPVGDSNATLSKQTTEDDQGSHKCCKTVDTSSISGNLPAEMSNNADEGGLVVNQKLSGKDEVEPSNLSVNTPDEQQASVDVAVQNEHDTILEVPNGGGYVSSDKPEIISSSDTQDIEHSQSVEDKQDATEVFILEKYPHSQVTYENNAVTGVESSKASSTDIPDEVQLPSGTDDIVDVNEDQPTSPILGVSLLYNDNEVKVEVGSSKKGPHEVESTLDCASDGCLPLVEKDDVSEDVEKNESKLIGHCDSPVGDSDETLSKQTTEDNQGGHKCSITVETSSISANLPAETSNNADDGGLLVLQKSPGKDEVEPSNLAVNTQDEQQASIDVAVPYEHDTIHEVQNGGASVSSDKHEIISCSDTQDIEHSQSVKHNQDATDGFQLVSSSNNADEGGLVVPQKLPEKDEVEPSNLAVNTPDEQQASVDVAVPYQHDIEVQTGGGSVSSDKPEIISCLDTQDIEHSQSVKHNQDATEGFFHENYPLSKVTFENDGLQLVSSSNNADEEGLVVPQKLAGKDEKEPSILSANTPDDQQASVDVAVQNEHDTILEVPNGGGSVSSDKPEIISCSDTQDIECSQSVEDKQDATEVFILEKYPHSKVTSENDGCQPVSSSSPSNEEQSFTLEVDANTGQNLSTSKNTKESSVSPCASQSDPVKLHEHIVVSPETPMSTGNEAAPKKTSERKPRRKSVGRESSKKRTQLIATTPNRRSQAKKLRASLTTPPATEHVTLAKDSKSNEGASSSLKLPDLNNSISLFPRSFTDNQQVQLRAQILVYGSLISGASPDEPHMIAAFGQSDGGRRTWEAAWHACLERVHDQKSVVNNLSTPMQSRSGNKDSDQANTHASAQSKVISSPTISPMIPISSPLWNFSTPCGVQASAMPRSAVLDYRPTFSPLHPYQTPQVQNIAGHNPSWLSQGPFPGQWIATSPVAPFSAPFSALPITESVKLTTVKESGGPGIPLVSMNPVAGPTISSVPVMSGQPSSDTKSRKRKKAAATQIEVGSHSTPVTRLPWAPHTEGYNQISFPSHNKTNSATALLVTSQPSISAPLSTPFNIPKSNHSQVSCADENIEKSVTREDIMSNIEQSKVHASDAAVQAAAAVSHCQTVWSQMETQKNSALISDEEAKVASSITAASSVARVAAAAAKIASNVAEQARLMADEVFRSSYDHSIMISHDKSTSIISAAREAARRRIEAASVASKHAENLDAIVKAAELAAEAVSQAGKIVAMGNPLTSTKLVESGPDGYCKTPQLSNQPGYSDKQNNETDFNEKEIQTLKRDLSLRKNSQDLAQNQMLITDGISGSGTSFENDKSTIDHKGPDGTLDVDHNATQSSSGSWNENIIEGSFVEVYKDVNKNIGAWFAANVLTLKDGKALVRFTEIHSDDGSGKLEQWVPLEVEGTEAPRIRIAHRLNTMQFEGTRKRGRTALIDNAWCSGDRVDVWVHDRWCEAVVVETNKIDVTSLTVQFPDQEKTSAARSWHVRPTLIWKDGKWIEWSSLKGCRSSEGDTPHEKRLKVGNPVVDGKEKGNISSIVIDLGERGRPKDSKILTSSAHRSLFDVGKSSKNENKLNTHRTMKTGIQKERSRVVFGIPKPGKKQKFVNVSTHYVADANDSDKITSYSTPCGSKEDSKHVAEVKSKFHMPRKPPIPLLRPINLKDKSKASKSMSHDASSSDTNDKDSNFACHRNRMDFGSSNTEDAEEPSTSKSVSQRLNKRKVATPGDRKTTNVEVKDKFTSEVEPRRSHRKIQPTSRLLEGLQSSMTISKMPTVSHAIQRSHNKVTPKGSTNSG
ncbi:uncharacterized protein [Rutidosis leptorrhynchoides]|uniref:uncharacterized protein n=1 Tax=Rutidosis leptorrhynchoides TaxID=125765 RepID=UPI003A9A5817